MTDGPRQRGSASGSSGDAAAPGAAKDGGGGVALKKEIGLVSACGIIVGKCPVIALIACEFAHFYLFVIFCTKKKECTLRKPTIETALSLVCMETKSMNLLFIGLIGI